MLCTVSTREEHRLSGGERFLRRTVYIIDYRTNQGVDEFHNINTVLGDRVVWLLTHTTEGQKIIVNIYNLKKHDALRLA